MLSSIQLSKNKVFSLVLGLCLFLLWNIHNLGHSSESISVSMQSLKVAAEETSLQKDGYELLGKALPGTSRKLKFAVLTFTTRENSYTYMSLQNKQRMIFLRCLAGDGANLAADYARRHGYDFIVDFEAPRRRENSGIWVRLVTPFLHPSATRVGIKHRNLLRSYQLTMQEARQEEFECNPVFKNASVRIYLLHCLASHASHSPR